jgi:hypothetical protein
MGSPSSSVTVSFGKQSLFIALKAFLFMVSSGSLLPVVRFV